jgi:hypothetical protein
MAKENRKIRTNILDIIRLGKFKKLWRQDSKNMELRK